MFMQLLYIALFEANLLMDKHGV